VTDKLQGTCSVCLRVIQLRGDRPIRHGFSAVGVRHGQSGGYHTGPCAGTQFPHLGISSEGTQWALDRERKHLDRLREKLAHLATNPDLTWYPKKYDVKGGRADLSRPFVVQYGAVEPIAYRSDSPPSYARLHKAEVAQLEGHVNMAERAIAEYERVLASYSPTKYPVSGAPGKIETTHMATPRKNNRGEEWTGVLCRFTRQGYASDKLAKTTDPSKVTCKRCRDMLGLPPT
jgi:hypothetical protein